MEEFNDKSETVIFNPIKEEKKVVERVDDDEFSLSRKPPEEEEYYVKRKEKASGMSEKTLIAIVAVLAVLFVVVVILAISVMNGNKGETSHPDNTGDPGVIVEDPEEEPIEDEPEEEIVVFERKAYFKSGSVEKDGSVYTVRAEIYDENGNKLYEKRLSMDSSTVIKENGKELIIKRFIDIVDSLGDNKFMFDAEINEEEYFIVSVSYRKEEIEDVLNQEQEEPEEPEEVIEPGAESEPAEEPAEKSEPEDGVVVE